MTNPTVAKQRDDTPAYALRMEIWDFAMIGLAPVGPVREVFVKIPSIAHSNTSHSLVSNRKNMTPRWFCHFSSLHAGWACEGKSAPGRCGGAKPIGYSRKNRIFHNTGNCRVLGCRNRSEIAHNRFSRIFR